MGEADPLITRHSPPDDLAEFDRCWSNDRSILAYERRYAPTKNDSLGSRRSRSLKVMESDRVDRVFMTVSSDPRQPLAYLVPFPSAAIRSKNANFSFMPALQTQLSPAIENWPLV